MFVIVLSILLPPVTIRTTPSPSNRWIIMLVPKFDDKIGKLTVPESSFPVVIPNTLLVSPAPANAIFKSSRSIITSPVSMDLSVGEIEIERTPPCAVRFPAICIFSSTVITPNCPTICSFTIWPSVNWASNILESGSFIPMISGSNIRTDSATPRFVRKNRNAPPSSCTIPCSPLV